MDERFFDEMGFTTEEEAICQEEWDELDCWKLYLQEVGKTKLLSQEEEIVLGKCILVGGEAAREARNKLVEANLKLVAYYAKQYINCGLDLEDLNSLGTEGLMKAAEKFDYTLGNRFATYATWWIRQSIQRGLSKTSSNIRIPDFMGTNIRRINKVKQQYYKEHGTEPGLETLIKLTELDRDTVEIALQSVFSQISMDMGIGEEGDATLGDILEDKNAPDPCREVMYQDMKEAVHTLLSQLEEKEARVLSLRYGIGIERPMTLEEVGKLPEFQLSRERIRQIEEKALRKIRRSPKLLRLIQDYEVVA